MLSVWSASVLKGICDGDYEYRGYTVASIRKSFFFKFVVVTAICSAFVAGLYYYSGEKSPIYDFVYARDMKEVSDIFERDWFWLVYQSTPEEYSPDFTFKFRTPDRNPRSYGKLIVKVLREGDKLAGFTAYYKLTFYKGFILYVAVARELRGKGYGEKLTRYAIRDLFSRGCKVIELVTRLINKQSRGLYKKLGFTEGRIENEELIYYTLKAK